MLARIAREAAADPAREVCGLLTGDDVVSGTIACANVAADPARAFEIDPAALIAAHRDERRGGPALAGCYHSHPTGKAWPSARDAANAAPDGWLWLIAGGGRIAAFLAVEAGEIHGRFAAVGIEAV